jgi:hypothetical protein
MVSTHRKMWKWLQLLAVGLLFLGAFAPLSDPLDRISTGAGALILVAWLGATWWEERRERQADQPSDTATSSSD